MSKIRNRIQVSLASFLLSPIISCDFLFSFNLIPIIIIEHSNFGVICRKKCATLARTYHEINVMKTAHASDRRFRNFRDSVACSRSQWHARGRRRSLSCIGTIFRNDRRVGVDNEFCPSFTISRQFHHYRDDRRIRNENLYRISNKFVVVLRNGYLSISR